MLLPRNEINKPDRSWFSIKAEGLMRYLMVHALSGALPLYIVTEYPKSGGSWVSQMLSDYLNVPFPRNQFPKIQPCIIHGHYLYAPSMKNAIVVLRDGRDVMVSFYYQSLFANERFNSRLVKITRSELQFDDCDDIRKNLPRFIEYKFTGQKHPRFTWCNFINDWLDRDVAFIRYENLLRDPVEELAQALLLITKNEPDRKRLVQIVEEYSFENLAKRKRGEENRNSFLRKGIAGDWKNHFSREAKEIFNKFGGRELIRLGYETDEKWAYD